jgi:hypothetical protein
MLTKILVTLVVIALGWLAVRDRWRGGEGGSSRERSLPASQDDSRDGLMPRGAVRLAAYGLVVLMLLGTSVYLLQGWQRDREVVDIQVVNAYTGEIQRYEARRGDIDRRSFVALDGRRVQIAEMERLILLERSR